MANSQRTSDTTVETPGFEPGAGWVQTIHAVPSAVPWGDVTELHRLTTGHSRGSALADVTAPAGGLEPPPVSVTGSRSAN